MSSPIASSVRRCGRSWRRRTALRSACRRGRRRRDRERRRAARRSLDDGGVREPVHARLIVAADGAHSVVRAAAGIEACVEDYEQVAIVANVAADRPHDGTAYERFTPSGPLAVLPLHDGGYGVIWTAAPERAAELAGCRGRMFLPELQKRFGWRAGRLVRAGRRASYPLEAHACRADRGHAHGADRKCRAGAASGGGAGIQPRACAMRRCSRRCIAGAPARSGRCSRCSSDSRAGARGIATGVIRFTDGLVKLFGDSRPGLRPLRNLGLLLFDLTPPAKSALARVSAGFAGPAPRLARGLAVR